MKVSRVSEMQEMDRAAVEAFGIAPDLLMENAGNAVYWVILNQFGVRGQRFVVFAGPGNNGGDGLVVARKLLSSGGDVKVFLLSDPARYKGSAKVNFEIATRLPLEIARVESIDAVAEEIARCDAIVDAILGTGLTREVEGRYRQVIEQINAGGKTVFSVDIPSGVSGDTGKVMGAAVRADYTVTFGLPKIGSMLYPGYELGGKLYVSHISFPPALYEVETLRVAISEPLALPPRRRDGHKGDFGKGLFIAGAASYFGAPYFSALSFLKAGGGYSRLAAPRSIVPAIAGKGSEIVFVPQMETASGGIDLRNKEALLDLAARMDMVVLGPGLSLDAEVQKLVRALAAAIPKPLLIDGDGITAVCQDLQSVRERTAPTILTPHLGEMSRIVGLDVADIDVDKVDVLQRATRDLNATIVLKGAHSLVGYPDGRVFINMSGNPGMATAGSGDILTGTIAAMVGLGLPVDEAVRQGVFVHGLAGDLAAMEKGEDGMTAQDILDALPLAVRSAREGLSAALQQRYVGAREV
ncbi:MAG: NAD(P)H-hydrate dehydratase [Anaerolineae bacterium]|nr:NAD(P)H-hydrate dehydratase [Anaerolineae bacterium]